MFPYFSLCVGFSFSVFCTFVFYHLPFTSFLLFLAFSLSSYRLLTSSFFKFLYYFLSVLIFHFLVYRFPFLFYSSSSSFCCSFSSFSSFSTFASSFFPPVLPVQSIPPPIPTSPPFPPPPPPPSSPLLPSPLFCSTSFTSFLLLFPPPPPFLVDLVLLSPGDQCWPSFLSVLLCLRKMLCQRRSWHR